jgi:hypothetical protein
MKRRYPNALCPSTSRYGAATRTGGHLSIVTAVISAIVAFVLVFSLAGCFSLGIDTAFATPANTNANVTPAATKVRVNTTTAGTIADAKSATVLVYMNGSDLESEAGEATSDIAEMLESGIGKNANVVIETLGTKEWQAYGIASDHTQRYLVNQGKLELVDDSLGQLDTTSPDTLADFISWGVSHFPADRYMLILWDHGAGPVYGFGYDEFQSDYAALTLDEMQEALEANANVHFDVIGMDCCIMSSLETYYVLAPFCDYAILSEDFEPGIGWSYENWMSLLEANPAIDTVELGTAIVDDMISAVAADPENGDATLALVDESAIPQLYNAWIDFAYANKDALLNTNYSQEVTQHGREGLEMETTASERPGGLGHIPSHNGYGNELGFGGLDTYSGRDYGFGNDTANDYGYGNNGNHGYWLDEDYGYGNNGYGRDDAYGYWLDEDSFGYDDNSYGFGSDNYSFGNGGYGSGWDNGGSLFDYWDYDMSYVTMSDYFVTDIMSVASTIDSDKSATLEQALNNAIVHYGCTEGEEGLTGMGITLPYGDAEFYDQLTDVFAACEIDSSYIAWLDDFVEAEGANNYFDYSDFADSWHGWDSLYGDNWGSYDDDWGSYDDGWSSYADGRDSESYWGQGSSWHGTNSQHNDIFTQLLTEILGY